MEFVYSLDLEDYVFQITSKRYVPIIAVSNSANHAAVKHN
jgi:hypothetical protein